MANCATSAGKGKAGSGSKVTQSKGKGKPVVIDDSLPFKPMTKEEFERTKGKKAKGGK